MEERIVIKGTPQKNIIARIIMIVGIVLIFVSILVAYYLFSHYQVNLLYGSINQLWVDLEKVYDGSFFLFFISELFDIDLQYGPMTTVGLIAAIIGIVMKVKTEKCEITVTNQMIMGKLPRGKEVSIPMNQITAINPSSFNGISIASIGNVSNFYCFKNRDEVVKAIAYLLANPQQATVHDAQLTASATAEVTDEEAQLKRLKELLDVGVLTQEEFDAKKKQILGL